ncbi:MAG: EpsG family protein [Desemzia incerta]|uniref:EpsG family protein n=1 Tax=Desemzia incerta TaxID=82801 RepID=UPI0033145070
MNILQVNLLLLFIYSLLLKFKKKNLKKLFLFLMTTQLILINGLRSMWIGTDTNRYFRYFNEVRSFEKISSLFDYNMEIGYTLYQKAIGLITTDFNVFLLITAALIYIPVAFFVYNYSKNFFLSYLLFITFEFFAFTLSGIRQSLAISIGLFAFHFAVQKKPKFFLFAVLLAISFHTSAVVLLMFYPLINVKLNTKHLIFLTLTYTAFFIFRYRIGALLTIFYYDDRSTSMIQQYDVSSGIGGVSLLLILLVILSLIFQNVLNNNDRVLRASFNIMIIALFFQTLSAFSYLFTRLNMYFLILIIIFVPNIFQPISTQKIRYNQKQLSFLKIVLKLILIIYFVYYYQGILEIDIDNLLPYKFYWQ